MEDQEHCSTMKVQVYAEASAAAGATAVVFFPRAFLEGAALRGRWLRIMIEERATAAYMERNKKLKISLPFL